MDPDVLTEEEFVSGRPVMDLSSAVVADDASLAVIDKSLGTLGGPVGSPQVFGIVSPALSFCVELAFQEAPGDDLVKALVEGILTVAQSYSPLVVL